MGVPKGEWHSLLRKKKRCKMTVWECMEMLGKDTPVRISERHKMLIVLPFSASDYKMYPEEFPRDVYEPILEKTAAWVDLVRMVICCEG